MAKAKAKRLYGCTECGATFPKWAGQCGECGAWNTLVETVVETSAVPSGRAGWAGAQATIKTLAEVSVEETPRFTTDSTELDRVLGGGLVDGSVVLIGGDPGIGKSTILLQTLCHLAARMPALYVTGEESQQQVAMRARRLGLPEDKLKVMTETCIESIVATARQEKPRRRGRGPGTRERGPAGAVRQADRHRHLPGRPRHQGRRPGRAAGAGAHGRHRALFRG